MYKTIGESHSCKHRCKNHMLLASMFEPSLYAIGKHLTISRMASLAKHLIMDLKHLRHRFNCMCQASMPVIAVVLGLRPMLNLDQLCKSSNTDWAAALSLFPLEVQDTGHIGYLTASSTCCRNKYQW